MRRLLGGVQPESLPPLPAVDGANGDDNKFDTNMLIILAALLCALVCALGLNSLVQWAGRRAAFWRADASGLPAMGLRKKALRQIPVAVYGEGAGIHATDCPICLGEFAEGEKVKLLPPCNHGFHVHCIDTWLASHSSCPTCRGSLLSRTVAASADGGGQRPRGGSSEMPGGVVPAVL